MYPRYTTCSPLPPPPCVLTDPNSFLRVARGNLPVAPPTCDDTIHVGLIAIRPAKGLASLLEEEVWALVHDLVPRQWQFPADLVRVVERHGSRDERLARSCCSRDLRRPCSPSLLGFVDLLCGRMPSELRVDGSAMAAARCARAELQQGRRGKGETGWMGVGPHHRARKKRSAGRREREIGIDDPNQVV